MKDIEEILVIDIETTGFKAGEDFILELGAVELNLITGKRTTLFDKVFKHPDLTAKHHDAWIFKNGYMTVDEVRKAKPIDEDLEELETLFSEFSGRITAWNRFFDSKFLEYEGFDLGTPLACPMLQSTSYFKLPKKSGNGYKWPKAQEAWDRLFPDNPRPELHRGGDDADFEAIIIKELYDREVYEP